MGDNMEYLIILLDFLGVTIVLPEFKESMAFILDGDTNDIVSIPESILSCTILKELLASAGSSSTLSKYPFKQTLMQHPK
jgi:hypothetical protein